MRWMMGLIIAAGVLGGAWPGAKLLWDMETGAAPFATRADRRRSREGGGRGSDSSSKAETATLPLIYSGSGFRRG